ncbi:hypothetical protein QE394_002147 [Arthrobacter sp. SORGH_AS 212]|nr:hypothetical protein [Arthrobacter sp. SORGH_AS_0212]
MGDELRAELALAQLHHGEYVLRHAGFPQGFDHHGTAAGCLLGRFDDDGGAGGECREGGPGRDGDREVPWRRDNGELRWDERGAVDRVQLAGGLCVVVREVHRLADLGVALVDGLAGLAGHDFEKIGAAGFQGVAGAVQDFGAFGAGECAPGLARLDGGFDGRVQRCLVIDEGRLDRGVSQRGARNAVQDGPAPSAVGGQGGIRVRGVFERIVRHRDRRQAAVLAPAGERHTVVQGLQGGEEALLFAFEQGLVLVEFEHGGHEVVLAGALFKAADQVGDGDVELSRVHHGRVEEQRADVLLHGFGLALRHAQQHLELDTLLCGIRNSALLGQQPGEGNIEQVVAGHADPDVLDPLRVQRVVDDALVAGVGILLRTPGGQGPVVQRGFHLFHGQVGALDHADLDAGAAVGAALRGPVLQPDHGGQCVREVSLEHDAGLEVLELRLVQDPGEDRDGHVQVLVFLHVQVNELGFAARAAAGGGEGSRTLEERGELLDDVFHGFVERPGGMRSHRGGDLDGDVVDVGTRQQRVRSVEPAGGLVLAEDCLAEEVDVELDAVLFDLRDGRAQLGIGGVNDQVAHHFAEHPAGCGDDYLRQRRGHGPAERHGAAHVPGQERRHLGRQRSQVAGGDVQVLGADHAVHEAHSEVQAVGVLQDSGQLFGGGIHRNLRGLGKPAPDQGDRLCGEGFGLGDVDVDRLRGGRVGDCRFHCNVGHGFPRSFLVWEEVFSSVCAPDHIR